MKKNVIKLILLILVFATILLIYFKYSYDIKNKILKLSIDNIQSPTFKEDSIKKVILKKISLQEIGKFSYDYKYDDKEMSGEYTVFSPKGLGIKKLDIIKLEGDKEYILDTIRNIEEDKVLLLDIAYKSRANRKIKWTLDDGNIGEYFFQDNFLVDKEKEYSYR